MAPVNPKMHDFGSPEPLSARPGLGEPKMHDFGSPEMPRFRSASNDLKMHDSGSPELPGARSGSGEPKSCIVGSPGPGLALKCPNDLQYVISVHRSCQGPGLAPVNQKIHNFGSPELHGAGSGSGEPRNV